MSTNQKPKKPKSNAALVFDVYRGDDGWRWRLWAKNGRIVATSGEGYVNRGQAMRMCRRLIAGCQAAELIVLEGSTS